MAEEKAIIFQRTAMVACNGSIPRRKKEKSLTPWWTAELQRWKRKTRRARITAQQERDQDWGQQLTAEFKRTRVKYKNKIKEVKLRSFREILSAGSPEDP